MDLKNIVQDFRWMIVGSFGFLGAISRSLVFEFMQERYEIHLSVLFINAIGCFILGSLQDLTKLKFFKFISKYQKEILSGFVGSFTTFAMVEFASYNLFELRSIGYSIEWILFEIILCMILYKYGKILSLQIISRINKAENISSINQVAK
jgi:fluoride ion exporter CrcB/FEX